jgi:5-methylcytosine-specific restriction enzyme A
MAEKIPPGAIPVAYNISKKVYQKELSFTEGRLAISINGPMNVGSAGDYINNFKYLIDGKRFTRTLNVLSMEYYLDNILKDYGSERLSIALQALEQHIVYYENVQKTKVTLHKMRGILQKYLNTVAGKKVDVNEQEQNEIIQDILSKGQSKEQLLIELLDLKQTDPEEVIIMGRAYKRDNKTIAQIKLLRGIKCQFCGTAIKKRDGSFYVEAAHIKAKHMKGCETLDNILLLCPNHHKEFDLGSRIVKAVSKNELAITLNGVEYIVQMECSIGN